MKVCIKNLLLLIVFVFAGFVTLAQSGKSDNPELKEIYKADQADRTSGKIDWLVVSRRDNARMARVYELLSSNEVVTGKDYYNAAMVFQHGSDTVASAMAVKMMRKAIELDSSTNKWLLAAAIDRDLMRRNQPQIYGTQYMKSNDGPWQRWKIDSTKISDQERIEYGVETLGQQREKERLMNKKPLNELIEESASVEQTIKEIREEWKKGDGSAYNLSEAALNSLGYELKGQKKIDAALQVFKLNTEFYPNGFNTWDSLGECLLELGKKKEAIEAYKKSLALNPKNMNAKKIIEEQGK